MSFRSVFTLPLTTHGVLVVSPPAPTHSSDLCIFLHTQYVPLSRGLSFFAR